ncbi:sugar ABC transporter ATP-binding protein [Streptomyces sp. NPDC059455]|uniref:sugar ABC transporter ATP-binding protein n=1 Tax=Streptomyces sp. NPDC059455 TaxID=3346837 RepID=UPI0036897840
MTGTTAATGSTVLAVRELSKTFPGQRALDRVGLELRAGEVHALLGENGCGKSTLIKCLAGFYQADAGAAIEIDGRPLAVPHTTTAAAEHGLVFVHQDLGLIPSLSVAENFAVSRRYGTRALGRIDWSAVRAAAARELTALGHPELSVDTAVGRLPVASQTIVAIARALAGAERGARVLVLDEPTAALPEAEAERLFAAVRQVTAQGVAVLYVSHKLEEILRIADRATVLRDGRRVDTVQVPGLGVEDLVRLIVGRGVASVRREHAVPRLAGERLLDVQHLTGRRLRDVSFQVRRGEIVGIAGMLGSGRSELARLLFGAQSPAGGEIRMRGTRVALGSPRDAVRQRIALIPEDRRREGGVLEMDVAKNLTLPSIRRFWRRARLAAAAERSTVSRLIDDYHVSPASPTRSFKNLSGGNQQKVVIAKWLDTKPDLLIFDEPVQGVDVGARAEIFRLVHEAAAGGAGVLLISSETDEMLQLADRVLILRGGRLIQEVDPATTTAHEVTHLMHFDAEHDLGSEQELPR